ncbi:MAG: HlyD family efflux transporter periplasmic adaptor subunit [Clostridia bacterium]|nr:HlyD family efflux transporter periplasmic adaptor subunit [Clostridia bacterium]
MRNKKTRIGRVARRLLMLPVVLIAAFLIWNYVRPLLSDEMVTTYAAHTVSRGDIATDKSFSATLDVLHSETHTYQTDFAVREVTSIKKLYVQSGQYVEEDDKLLQLENGTLYRAGINGTVNDIRFREGDWVWPNVNLIQICDLTNLQVSLSVDEYDIDKVAVGQPCTVTIVPLGLEFETEVAHVDRVSASSGSVAYYAVTAELTVPENVLPGMTASVSIPADEALDVLMLDMQALSFDEERKPYVLVKNGDAYQQVFVETGLSDGVNVEIRSGLHEGDMVYVVTGSEKAVQPIALMDIYKKLVGETVVIRDRSEKGRTNRRMPEGSQMPDRFKPDTERSADIPVKPEQENKQ